MSRVCRASAYSWVSLESRGLVSRVRLLVRVVNEPLVTLLQNKELVLARANVVPATVPTRISHARARCVPSGSCVPRSQMKPHYVLSHMRALTHVGMFGKRSREPTAPLTFFSRCAVILSYRRARASCMGP